MSESFKFPHKKFIVGLMFGLFLVFCFQRVVRAQFDDPYDGDFTDYVYDASYGNSSYDSCYSCDIAYDSQYLDSGDYVYDATYGNSTYDSFYSDVSYDFLYSDSGDYVYDSSYGNSVYDSSYGNSVYDSSYDASYDSLYLDSGDYTYDSSYGNATYDSSYQPTDSYPAYPDYGGAPPPPCNDCSTQFINTQAAIDAACAGGCTAQEKAQVAADYLNSIGFSATITSTPDGGYTVTCSNDGSLPIPPDTLPLDAYPSYPGYPADAYPSYPADAYPGYPGNPPADAYPSYPADAYPDYPPADAYPSYGGGATLGVILSGRVNLTDPWTTVSINGTAPINNVDLKGTVFGTATGNVRYDFDCTNDGVYDFSVVSPASTYTALDLCDYPLPGIYTVSLHVIREGIHGYATIQVGATGAVNDVSIVLKNAGSSFSPGEAATFIYTVSNLGPAPVTTDVGFWKNNPGLLQTCPGSPISPLADMTSPPFTIQPGDSFDVPFTFNVSNSPGIYTAYAYVTPDCVPADDPGRWSNNISTGKTYQVASSNWFRTIGGDVGAFGDITVAGVALPPAFTSEYLLAGNPLGANATTGRWKLDNYNKPQVSQDVYAYINSKFAAKATLIACDLASLTPTTPGSSFNHCTGDVSLSGSIPVGNNYVWFIDGNLNITGDLTVPANSTMVFVVKGNVIVNTNVNRSDGVYIVKGTLTDVDSSGNTGLTLNIDGAIYATGNVNLPRTLSNNSLPADVVTFQARYVQTLNDLLGTASITWQEVAP